MIWNENRENAYCEITPAILALKEQWEKENYIDPRLYKEYNVKRGLRDEDGRGVLTGLTRVAEIQSYTVTADEHILPADGVLYYRGIDCREIVRGSEARGRFAFEEAAYLLLFGELPSPGRMVLFILLLGIFAIGAIGLENVLRQCLQLLSNMPVLAIYAYQAWRYYEGASLFIHVPQPELSAAENFLYMLREDRSYTDLESRTLDVALVLHLHHPRGHLLRHGHLFRHRRSHGLPEGPPPRRSQQQGHGHDGGHQGARGGLGGPGRGGGIPDPDPG